MDSFMSSTEREICEAFQELDEVQLRATLATAAAMAAGLNNVAALAAGNIVLAAAGYPPAPVYISVGGHADGEAVR